MKALLKHCISNVLRRIEALSNYSTTEKVVGKWIDGKPIYRKVWTTTTFDANNQATINTNISIDNIINLYGTVKASGGRIIPINKPNPNNITYTTATQYYTDGRIFVEVGTAYTPTKALVVMEYTKTND